MSLSPDRVSGKFKKNVQSVGLRLAGIALTAHLSCSDGLLPTRLHAQQNTPAQNNEAHLYKGSPIREEGAPYYVSINTDPASPFGYAHYFGGAIIGENTVLTAGHYGLRMVGDNAKYTVVNPIDPKSSLYWDPEEFDPGEVITATVVEVLFPPGAQLDNQNRIPDDISVVCTDKSLIPSNDGEQSNQIIEVASPDDITDGTIVNIVGNGNTDFAYQTGAPKPQAEVITDTLKTPATCRDNLQNNGFWSGFVGDDQLCIGDAAITAETSLGMTNSGDSGSPITSKNGASTPKLLGPVSVRLYNKGLNIFNNASRYGSFIADAKITCAGLLGGKPPIPEVTLNGEFVKPYDVFVATPTQQIAHVQLGLSAQGIENTRTDITFQAQIPDYDCGTIDPNSAIEVEGNVLENQSRVVSPKRADVKLVTELDQKLDQLGVTIPVNVSDCKSSDPTSPKEIRIQIADKWSPNGEQAGPIVAMYENAHSGRSTQHVVAETRPEQLMVYTSFPLSSEVYNLTDGQVITGATFPHANGEITNTIPIITSRSGDDLTIKLERDNNNPEYAQLYLNVIGPDGKEMVINFGIRNNSGLYTITDFFRQKNFIPIILSQ